MIPLGVLASARVAAGGPATLLEYVGSATSTSDATTYTFADVPIGAAYTGREIIVAAIGAYVNDAQLSAATIGGAAATLDSYDGYGGWASAGIFRGAPTGDTTTITATFSVIRARCAIYVFRTAEPVTCIAIQRNNGFGTSITRAVTAGAGATVLVAGGAHANNTSLTWTGCTEVAADLLESTSPVGVATATATGASVTYGVGVSVGAQLQLRIAAYAPA